MLTIFFVAFALTIFTGAFLLFQVQPTIGKYILPWFGSGPGVWTTCMLFFQLVLLGGYAYAHFISHRFKPRTQVVVHLALVGAALAVLPITPSDIWKPRGSGDPRLQILLVLAASIGLPYFALSATGPLIQQWFNRVRPGGSPYRLYALSNAGSLLALLSYPFYFEIHFTRNTQAGLWAWGLVAFAVCCGFCAVQVWKCATPNPKSKVDLPGKSAKAVAAAGPEPTIRDHLLWLLLPACASVLLLATTNKICQDVTVIPLLWVAPLALYLLSFIICFDNARWYRRLPFAVALAFGIAGVVWALSREILPSLPIQLGIYLAGLFVCCMVCHGELYRLRPTPAHLTGFYLMIAAGGALGGVFVTLVAPLIFTDYDELPWGLLLCAILLLISWLRNPNMGRFGAWRPGVLACSVAATLALGVSIWLQVHRPAALAVTRSRNFYGVLAIVKDDPGQSSLYCLKLYHGRTVHGLQLQDPTMAALPTAYYGENSGVGRVLRSVSTGHRRIGLVGLGAGTLATYLKKGDSMRIYEINPEVERLARSYFTYLPNCAGDVELALGDARLSLERDLPQNFDVLVLDAFSGDAVPMHLLTREAFALYQQHLKPNGVIAVHISNRYLDLEPVVANAARRFNYRAVVIDTKESRDNWWLMDATWVVLSHDEEIFRSALIEAAARELRIDAAQVPLWTDDFASLYPIVRFETPPDMQSGPEWVQVEIASDLSEKGDIAGAIAHYRMALQINRDFPEALNNLAWLLASNPDASVRNGPEAVRLAGRACQLTEYHRTTLVGTLAAAYAEAGRFPEAVATAEKACALASTVGDKVLVARNRELLELYRDGKPYHEPASRALRK
jgi:tetratricopeptide (TPR) repeat protein